LHSSRGRLPRRLRMVNCRDRNCATKVDERMRPTTPSESSQFARETAYVGGKPRASRELSPPAHRWDPTRRNTHVLSFPVQQTILPLLLQPKTFDRDDAE